MAGTEVTRWEPQGRVTLFAHQPHPDARLSYEEWQYVIGGMPRTTRSTYEYAWRRWLRWTGEHGYCECPAEVATVVRWIRAQWSHPGRRGRPTSPSTLNLVLTVITIAHKNARRPDGTRGYETPVSAKEVQLARDHYVRDWLQAGHRPDVATAVTPEEHARMVATCDTRSPVGLLAAVVLAVIYDMGARGAELRAINHEDIELHVAGEQVGEDDFLLVHVPMSKTDQAGLGDMVYLYAHPEADAATCPVRLVRAWLAVCAEAGYTSGPLFRVVAYGNKPPADGRPRSGKVTDVRLTRGNLERIYARAVQDAGLPEEAQGRIRRYTLHGDRAGSITAAAEDETVSPAAIYEHFRFSKKSPVALRYMRHAGKKSQNPVRRVWRRHRNVAD